MVPATCSGCSSVSACRNLLPALMNHLGLQWFQAKILMLIKIFGNAILNYRQSVSQMPNRQESGHFRDLR